MCVAFKLGLTRTRLSIRGLFPFNTNFAGRRLAHPRVFCEVPMAPGGLKKRYFARFGELRTILGADKAKHGKRQGMKDFWDGCLVWFWRGSNAAMLRNLQEMRWISRSKAEIFAWEEASPFWDSVWTDPADDFATEIPFLDHIKRTHIIMLFLQCLTGIENPLQHANKQSKIKSPPHSHDSEVSIGHISWIWFNEVCQVCHASSWCQTEKSIIPSCQPGNCSWRIAASWMLGAVKAMSMEPRPGTTGWRSQDPQVAPSHDDDLLDEKHGKVGGVSFVIFRKDWTKGFCEKSIPWFMM